MNDRSDPSPAPGGSGELSSSSAIRLVAAREISTRVRAKSFRITSALLILLTIATVVVFYFIGGRTSSSTVGVISADSQLTSSLRTLGAVVNKTVKVQPVPSAAVGESQVRSGDIDAFVVTDTNGLRAIVKKNADDTLVAGLNVLSRQRTLDRQITSLGGDPASVQRALAATRVDVVTLEPESKYRNQRIALGIFAGIIVYLALMLYGQAVVQGVVEEKASRIVELLLTTVRPWQLMIGKVAGIGVVALGQLLVVAAVGLGAGLATDTLTLPASIAAGAVAWTLVWFFVGFVAYAFLFAAAGALVSRQEDAGAVASPIVMLIVIPYVLGISVLPSDPNNGLMAALSIVPVFSPTLMPFRAALGAPTWQMWLALGLTILLAVFLVWLAGRIYNNAVLRTGSRVRLSDALRNPA